MGGHDDNTIGQGLGRVFHQLVAGKEKNNHIWVRSINKAQEGVPVHLVGGRLEANINLSANAWTSPVGAHRTPLGPVEDMIPGICSWLPPTIRQRSPAQLPAAYQPRTLYTYLL